MNDRDPTETDERQVQDDQQNRRSERPGGARQDEFVQQSRDPSQSEYGGSERQNAPAGSQPPAQQTRGSPAEAAPPQSPYGGQQRGDQGRQGQTSYRGSASVQAEGGPQGQMQYRMETERGQSQQGGQFDGSSGTSPMQQGQQTFEQAMLMPFEQTVQVQRTAAELFLNGLELQENVQRRWTQMTRSLFYNYLDTVDQISRDAEQGVHRQIQTGQQFQPRQQMRGSYEVQGQQGQAGQPRQEARYSQSVQQGPQSQQGQYGQWDQQGQYGQWEQQGQYGQREQMAPQGRETDPRRQEQYGQQSQYGQRAQREREEQAGRRSERSQQTDVEARGEFEVGESDVGEDDVGEGVEETEHEDRDERDEE